MMDLEFLQSLIRTLDESSLDSIEIERGGTRVRLAKTPPAAPILHTPAPSPQSADAASMPTAPSEEAPVEGLQTDNLLEIQSPMVGTFYRAPAPDAPPYVDVGSRVKKGDTLCIIEAMKLMNELDSEVAGIVAQVLVDNGDPVEYGQVLFRMEPA